MNFEIVDEIVTTDDDALLSVPEFATQPEIDKHPSQVYGWMKRGLPVVVIDGQKRIPWDAGLKWFEEWQAQKGSSQGRPTTTRRKLAVEVGQFLRWHRGNRRGPGYGIIRKITGRMVWISAEYRVNPLGWSLDELERNLDDGTVVLVTATEVAAFLVHQFSRLDFLVCMVSGTEKAHKLKDAIYATEVLPPRLFEVYCEEGYREGHRWTGDKWLTDEELEETLSEKSQSDQDIFV